MDEVPRPSRAARPEEGQQRTTRKSPEMMLTVITGRITADVVRGCMDEYRALGGAPDWYFDMLATTGYSMDSVAASAQSLGTMTSFGLRRLVAVIGSSTVRMGASAVALTLPFQFKVVGTHEEARQIFAKPRP